MMTKIITGVADLDYLCFKKYEVKRYEVNHDVSIVMGLLYGGQTYES